MKKRTEKIKLVFAVLILAFVPYLQAAIDWDITEGTHTIDVGDDYRIVGVYNDAHLIITGGSTSYILANDLSVVDIYDNSTRTSSIGVEDQSTINIYGGDIYGVGIGETASATVNLFGGNISYIDYPEIGIFTINIYGYGFDYDGSFLRGFWLDGESFAISIRNSVYPSENINLIPEPISIVLFGIGGLFLRIKRYKNKEF